MLDKGKREGVMSEGINVRGCVYCLVGWRW
jgi:hypothetical protein